MCNYTIKYEAGKVEVLKDNRGEHRNPNERAEIERLRTEVKILRIEKGRGFFLKKLKEIEKRRG